MTELEARRNVKARLKKMRKQETLQGLGAMGGFLLIIVIAAAISTPFFFHIQASQPEPHIHLSHDWMVITGILSIPFSLTILAGIVMFFIILPIIGAKDARQKRKQEFEWMVELEMAKAEKEEKE